MDLVLGKVSVTEPVALTRNACFPVAVYLSEVEVREVLDTVVEGATGVVPAQSGDPLCKLGRSEGTREEGGGGDLRNSHDGGSPGT